MQDPRLKILGLYSQPNAFSEVPQGALEIADNIVIDRDSVASPRRGFEALSGTFSSSGVVANQLAEFKDSLIAHYGADKLSKYTTFWTDLPGSHPPPTGQRVRFAQASNNLYITTIDGVKRLDSLTGTPVVAGVPKALNVQVSLASGSSMADNNQRAYRVVWIYKDANKNLLIGAPSQRAVITNPTSNGSKAVDLTFFVPQGVTTDYFYQVYRSALSGGQSISPNDELYLVYENQPTSGEISAGSVTLTDNTPDDLTGATLYTSSSQETITQSNERPPLAHDLAVYKGFMFYGNTESTHRLAVTLLGVGVSGLSVNDTITIGAEVYTGKAAEGSSGSKEFKVSSGVSAAQDIEQTTLSLIKIINRDSTNYYAYYTSGIDDLPGQFVIEKRTIGGASFNVSSNSTTAWSPDLSTAQASANDDFANGLYFSKQGQPESTPLLNYFRVGSDGDPIQRIIALRDSLFIFKKTEGVYRLTGDGPTTFAVDLFDSSARLLASDTLAVLNNQIYGLFDQGVCAVSETGVQVVSRQIERTLLELQGIALDKVKSLAWACSYESDRKYILNLPSTSIDTATSQAFVFNTFTNTWVRWLIKKSCGVVRPSNDMLYVGDALANRVSVERKTYTFKDHVDEALPRSILTVNGTIVTLNDLTDVAVGDVIYQTATKYAIIDAVDEDTSEITMSYAPGFTVDSVQVLKAFDSRIKWHTFHAGAPMMAKHFREFSLLFERRPRRSFLRFSTEMAKAEKQVELQNSAASGFGELPWGMGPWGGAVGSVILRTYVTRDHRRATNLSVLWTHTQGYANFALNGAQVIFEVIKGGERSTR